jgi:hypothetical protein
MEDEKKSDLQISLGDLVCLCCLFVVHLAFPSYLLLLFVASPVHRFPHRQLSAHMDALQPCTP